MKPISAGRPDLLRVSCLFPLLLAGCGGRTDALGPGAPGSKAPVSSLQPAPLGAFPSGTIAVGGAFGGVTFYPPGATSDSTPIGELTWDMGNYEPQYMTFDRSGALYVESFLGIVDDGGWMPPARIDVFAPGAGGTTPATPVRTIAGQLTGLVSARSMVVDAQGNLYVTNAGAIQQGGSPSSVSVFSPDQSGDVEPSRIIVNAAQAFGWIPCGLAMDDQGNLYVGDSEPDTIDVFPSAASGTVAPERTTGNPALLGDTTGVALGSGRLYVANVASNEVDIFGLDGDDGGAPAAVLSGDRTGLSGISDIAVDHAGRILVTNQIGGLRVFAAGASGNVAPVAVVQPDDAYNVAVAP